ncbi:MAG: DUF1062 domain-containing protein [Minwuiales bacterium]|nr:DUF1062 domain-containing protein [Minwuiales bacterium]
MVGTLCVRWTVIPTVAPQPLLACPRCGDVTPFQSRDKVRLNAQGKRVDAWLIYGCAVCGKTWNRPILERRPVRDVEPDLLHALQANDADRVRALAFDLHGLRRYARHVTEPADVDARKRVLSAGPQPWSDLRIEFEVPFPLSARTDRLLAVTLSLSRSRIQRLETDGCLRLLPRRRRGLRLPVADGLQIGIDLRDLADGQDLARAAI